MGPGTWVLGTGGLFPFTVHSSPFTVYRSQPCRMIVKLPRQPELCRTVFGQRLDPHRFRGVVAGVYGVDPKLHRIEVGVVSALAGEIGVDSRRLRRRDPASRSSGDDAHPVALLGPARHQLRRGSQEGLDPATKSVRGTG